MAVNSLICFLVRYLRAYRALLIENTTSFFTALGDKDPSFLDGVYDLTYKNCSELNASTPDSQLVSYRSVMSKMNSIRSAGFPLNIGYLLNKPYGKGNDGLVTVESGTLW